MNFKQKKINKSNNFISNLFGLFSIIIVFLIGMTILKNIDLIKVDFIAKNNTGSIDDSSQESEDSSQTIFKEDKNKVNILVVGRLGGNHDAPNLTDTIILASIHTKKKTISLFSIPRDLYVEYEKSKDGKINGLYATYGTSKNNPEAGMLHLKRKITQITGEKIDHYINIDFEGFMKLIDAIGGIELTLDDQFVDYEYPDGNGGYKTLVFKKGSWLFDGENALKYARSRHSTSDFDRSLRQQEVISAVKNKLSGSYFLKSPTKLKEMYNIFNEYVLTDMKLEDIIKLSFVLKSKKDYDMLSFNLNDSCFYGSESCIKGGFLYIPSRDFFNGMSVLLIEGTDSNNLNDYSKVRSYIDMAINNPDVYKENYKLNVFNSLKINHLAGAISNDIVKYGFNMPARGSIGNTSKKHLESVLYYNNIESDSETLQALKQFFKGEFIEVDFPVYAKDLDTKIEIIIGEDYKGVFNF